jgi:alkylhydroperoxidase/carboxymuconolactone decarboxylase family protein YurZ
MSSAGIERANLINESRRESEDELVSQSSVYAEMVDRMAAVYGEETKPDGLDQGHRILIAVAMAVGSGSESAVEWTVTRAVNHGASEQQIRDAVDIALTNRGTFAVANARFAYEALRARLKAPRRSPPRHVERGDPVEQSR